LEKDKSRPDKSGSFEFDGVKFYEMCDLPENIEISIDCQGRMFLGNIHYTTEDEKLHKVYLNYEDKKVIFYSLKAE